MQRRNPMLAWTRRGAPLLLATTIALTTAGASTATARTLREPFRWQGPHAFFSDAGGAAVWWNQDRWDVRSDTHNESVARIDEATPWRGQFEAIMKAAAARDLKSEAVVDTAGAVGGDGSPGVGLMRLDFQGIDSARLRNPMLISARRPGSVSFLAPLFATTGHWWEVAITPTAQPIVGEDTAVPARQIPEALSNPVTGRKDDGSTNGPGHRADVTNSINVISTGYPDGPTCNGSGWHVRFAVTQASGGHVTDHVHARGSLDKLQRVDPDEHAEMYPWKIVFGPRRIQLFSDFKRRGRLSLVEQWRVRIPWRQVYVNLLYVAYQAGHHPQPDCGLHTPGIGQAETMGWRDVRVSPVRYARTYALPEPTRTENVARATGWMAYDLRNLGFSKEAQRGLAAPNPADYDKNLSYLFCSQDNHGGLPCPDRARSDVTLRVRLDARHLRRLVRAQLLADVRHPGSARIVVNRHPAGRLAGQPVLPNIAESGGFTDDFEPEAWVRHGIDIPRRLLHRGTNVVRILPTPGVDIDFDRIQLELDNR